MKYITLALLWTFVFVACSLPANSISYKTAQTNIITKLPDPKQFIEETKRAMTIREAYVADWNYFYSFAVAETNKDGKKLNDDATACKIADAGMRYSLKYKIDPQIIARKIWKETWYFIWARSHVIDKAGRYVKDSRGHVIPLAWGLAQINLDANSDVVEKIDGGKWKGKIRNRTDLEYLIWNVDINIECGCYILSNYLSMYATYELALSAYWAGQNSTEFRELRDRGIRNAYIDEILNPSVLEYNATLYHGWAYTNRMKHDENNIDAVSSIQITDEQLIAYNNIKTGEGK